jgi:hypothetical protein
MIKKVEPCGACMLDQTFGVIRNEVAEAWYAKRALEQQLIDML